MKKALFLSTISTFCIATIGSAVVYIDQSSVTPTVSWWGTQADPADLENVDANATGTGAVTLTDFNNLSDLNVMQSFYNATDTENIFYNAPAGLPDIRITTSGFVKDNTLNDADAFRTSGSGSWNHAFAWSGTQGQTLKIEFGTSDGASFSNDQTVKSAGLTFINFGGAYNGVRSPSAQTISYYNSSDVLLTQLSFAGGGDPAGSGGLEAFAGYTSTGQDIAYMVIAISRESGSSDIAIDDLAFVAVPEPSTFAILAGVMAIGFVMIRRRLRD